MPSDEPAVPADYHPHVLFQLNRLHRITLSKAARVIAVSQAVASQLQADNLVSAENISVVLNGIDTAKFAKARAEFNRRQFLDDWKLPEDSMLVGTVGELTPSERTRRVPSSGRASAESISENILHHRRH